MNGPFSLSIERRDALHNAGYLFGTTFDANGNLFEVCVGRTSDGNPVCVDFVLLGAPEIDPVEFMKTEVAAHESLHKTAIDKLLVGSVIWALG